MTSNIDYKSLVAGIKKQTFTIHPLLQEAVDEWNRNMAAVLGRPLYYMAHPPVAQPSAAWRSLYEEALLEANTRRWVVGL